MNNHQDNECDGLINVMAQIRSHFNLKEYASLSDPTIGQRVKLENGSTGIVRGRSELDSNLVFVEVGGVIQGFNAWELRNEAPPTRELQPEQTGNT